MPGPLDDKRNPLFIPDREPANRAKCDKCGKSDFVGRNLGGQIKFTCRTEGCGHEWYGGLPQQLQDPRIPLPPESYVPPVRFGKDSKGQPVELRRHVDTRTDFRKGALIPPEGEE